MNGSEPDGRIERLVLSYPDDLSEWSHRQVSADRYRNYLRKVFATPVAGDESEEFVDVGCCGNSLRFTVRVEAVEGSGETTADTVVDLVERREDVEGGWAVQSEAAPE